MLVINVRFGETVSIDNDRITLRVDPKDRERVTLMIEAPRSFSIRRLGTPSKALGVRQLIPATE